MKKVKNLSLLFILLLLIVILIEYSASSVEARKDNKKHQKQKKRPGNNQTAAGPVHSPVPLPASSPYYGPYPTHTNIYDILSFGAKGDGVSDDSKAFVAAWKAACKVPAATVEIPSEFRFLIKPLTLQGPCMPHLVLQRRSKHIPDLKPTALRFYASYNVNIRDITIINSPGCHLKFDGSGGVKVDNITISSPGDSPNTDGIHLQNAHDVEIKHSNIGCGDDCVSIQTGCSNVHVHHVNCGPGHGVSLGGLGKDKTVACVSGIVIENINIQNALSGVRIKTWQGGMGSVKNVSFSNIEVTDVEVPIMIDQYYCDRRFCKNQTEAVAITGVKYNQITGTYSLQPIHLACSNNVPCIDVDLIDIQLEPSPGSNGFQQALCWNSYGKSQAPLVPSAMDYCLRRGGSWAKRPAGSHDHSC
ncbi:polygalacturonase At1g48100 isoform X2 [Macadamia integrifolia]|uniref:polygalacturonase At1g48100 isoform X2 n=1 Tax=Macadamia integrifolia TaxID=60698 RepID=UPI001C4F165F|nr:polygalacturonase At1g48100 isoform X2 [Macadamia integrifolia]